MKKLIIILLILCMSTLSMAGGYVAIGGGSGGEAGGNNMSLSGGIITSEDPYHLFSAGVTYIRLYEDDITIVQEYGGYGKYGLMVAEEYSLYSFLTGGLTFDEDRYYGMYGIGLSHINPKTNVVVMIEYDNRRGITANLGYAF